MKRSDDIMTAARSRRSLRAPEWSIGRYFSSFCYVLFFLPLLSLTLSLTACGSFDSLPMVSAPSPYESYVRSLETANLGSTELGRSWIEAGQTALVDARPTELPFREVLYFDPARPRAEAFRIEVPAGQRLVVLMDAPVAPPSPSGDREGSGAPGTQEGASGWFLDLFSAGTVEAEARRLAQLETGQRRLIHEAERTGDLILRLQPELLVGGAVTLTVTTEGTLGFPVEGAGLRDVGSVFGDPRDGGARRHEGIDIFAPRGTPVVAPRDGWVVRAGQNRLGGKTVWMRSDGSSFYFAHLDEQSVSVGARVERGQEVGKVGNTGNAISTPPHLHFGMYNGGAVDPLPYLRSSGPAAAVTADRKALGGWSRVRRSVNFRSGPSTRSEVTRRLEPDAPLWVQGARKDWYRATLPDGTGGYVFASLTEPADARLKNLVVKAPARLLDALPRPIDRADAEIGKDAETADTAVRRRRGTHPPEPAAIALLAPGSRVAVLGRWGDHQLVRTEDGRVGWLAPGADEAISAAG